MTHINTLTRGEAEMSLLTVTASIPASHIRHREDFKAFVLHEAEEWHREHLGRLYTCFDEWNDQFYGGCLVVPYLMLLEPKAPRVYGDTSSYSGWGGKTQIRLRPSLLIGTHPHVHEGDEYAEGRFRVIADVMLHEMIHQYHQEITGEIEKAFHGHGPQFRDVCNRIGAAMGSPLVRSAKKRGPDAHLPSCAQWPHNVRPPEYYLGAYVLPEPEAPQAPPGCSTCARVQELIAVAIPAVERGDAETALLLLQDIAELVAVSAGMPAGGLHMLIPVESGEEDEAEDGEDGEVEDEPDEAADMRADAPIHMGAPDASPLNGTVLVSCRTRQEARIAAAAWRAEGHAARVVRASGDEADPERPWHVVDVP
jgi:hypothetical protein